MHYIGKYTLLASLDLKLQPILPRDFDRFSRRSGDASNRPTQHLTSVSGNLNSRGNLEFLENGTATISSSTHPEGSEVYSEGQLVSDDVLTPNLLDAGDYILDRYRSHNLTDITVFLRLNKAIVEYYVAEHQAKTVSWADNQRHESLSGLVANRVRNMLKEEYWTHVENFPGIRHIEASGVQDLKDVLASLAIDSGTSDGSTSPFSVQQIQTFLSFINSFGKSQNEFQTYAIARIWSMIWHARAVNNFGGPDACLDRFVVLSEQPESFAGSNLALARLTFGSADTHHARCRRTWAGRTAYVTEWRNFKAKNEKEWAQITQLACVLVLGSLLTHNQHNLHLLKMFSTSVAAGSAANGYYLTCESQNLGDNAADALSEMRRRKPS
ncbi:hypothetical protein FRC10_011073 [Ceratobasidium sp. 414]|nr:hypothetical protein FRC10_011073 [Ceratobasidium sp. 414]